MGMGSCVSENQDLSFIFFSQPLWDLPSLYLSVSILLLNLNVKKFFFKNSFT